jgi:DNA recombination protein RmuC
LETRVLVSARRFGELGVIGDEIATPAPVLDVPRPLTSGELLDTVAEPRAELPELDLPVAERPPVRRVAP